MQCVGRTHGHEPRQMCLTIIVYFGKFRRSGPGMRVHKNGGKIFASGSFTDLRNEIRFELRTYTRPV
jgi:hypothetical protein